MSESNAIDAEQYIPLVYSILSAIPARRRFGADIDNVIGDGMAELARCANDWKGDHKSGAKFLTYAYKCVRGVMLYAARREANFRSAKPKSSYTLRTNRLFMFSELGYSFTAGYAAVFARDDPTIEDIERREELKLLFAEPLRAMYQKYREVVTMRLGLSDREPMTLEEVGTKLDFSKEYVRQLEITAMRRVRNFLEKPEVWPRIAELVGADPTQLQRNH